MASHSNASYLPTWISDTEIDARWVEQAVPELQNVAKCLLVEDISNGGRRRELIKDGATLKVTVSFQDPSRQELSLVIKQVPVTDLDHSKMLGLSREALFYRNLAPRVMSGKVVPKVYYSYGDTTTGEKFILMEDLSTDYVDSGILFGPGNPNNWARDLPALISEAYPSSADRRPPTSHEVSQQTFLAIAKIHATFWKDESLLSHSYLRCADWVQGQNKASWEASQGYIQGIWEHLRRTQQLETVVQWDPVVQACLTKAMEGISWDAQLDRMHITRGHWTLVHGDFWPGNVMVSSEGVGDGVTAKELRLKLLDWEMVGIGSGPQDLGQYILSNMNPTERRHCERSLLEDYYSELIRCGVKDLSWEECWKEYQIGGVERWLWFLVYFIGQKGDLLRWAQFFHDQIASFVADHGITAEDIVQPRP
jgi:Ecdysteroid kinase-like family